jgi:hypothetical protein
VRQRQVGREPSSPIPRRAPRAIPLSRFHIDGLAQPREQHVGCPQKEADAISTSIYVPLRYAASIFRRQHAVAATCGAARRPPARLYYCSSPCLHHRSRLSTTRSHLASFIGNTSHCSLATGIPPTTPEKPPYQHQPQRIYDNSIESLNYTETLRFFLQLLSMAACYSSTI